MHAVALALALLLLPLGLGLAAACVAWKLSSWSHALALGLTLLGLVLLLGRRRGGTARAGLWLGLLLTLGPLLLRLTLARGSESFQLSVLPGDRSVRWVNTLYPESDGSMAAASALGLKGGLDDEEGPRLPEILAQAYRRVGSDLLPTPAIATYLGLQTSDAFDTLVIAPPIDPANLRGAVVFLHGYAGNFYVYCWEMAQAAAQANLLTLCPSVSARGDWWSAQGEQTFVRTLAALRARGIERIYLAGLSNGAAGATVIAARHARELTGLILISGARDVRATALPTLVIQGSRDRMMPASLARAYAGRGARARYREIHGGHLIFLSRSEEVRPLIAEFLLRN